MLFIIIVCCFAFCAGLVDALVGGGGLIQLPAMFIFFPELTLAQTLATNKTAGFMGTVTAAVRYSKKIKMDWKKLTPLVFAAGTSAAVGAWLVSYLHKEQMMPFLIAALCMVLIYTLLNKNLGKNVVAKSYSEKKQIVYAVIMGFAIGLYDGMIGPGTGSFLIFGLILIFGFDFLNATAHAKIINCATNLGALLLFAFRGKIILGIAIPIGIANIAGSYVGTHLALKKGSAFIRIFFLVIVVALILKLGRDYYFKS